MVIDFKPDDRDRLAIGDKIEIEAWGTGLAIEEFEDVRIPSLAPDLLEKIGVGIEDGRLTVPKNVARADSRAPQHR